MLKLYGFQATKKVAVAVNGGKRKDYKEKDTLLVTESEKLQLLRLGFKLIDEVEVSYSDIFGRKAEAKKTKAEAEETKAEAKGV